MAIVFLHQAVSSEAFRLFFDLCIIDAQKFGGAGNSINVKVLSLGSLLIHKTKHRISSIRTNKRH